MSGQTAYTAFQPAAVAGMVANTTDRTVSSFAAHEAISFGRAVTFQDQDKCRLTAAALEVTSELFLGFAMCDTSKETTTGYLQYEVVNVVREGDIYVESIDATAFGGAVYVVTTAGANRGKVTANSGSGSLLPRAKFMQTIGAAGLVLISFDAR